MRSPYLIDGPTCISLSGGRTSAHLLFMIIRANGGIPAGTVILFCNTGKEEEATLRFIRDIANHWNVTVVWLEYRSDSEFEVVTFETASRNGEPFEAIIRQRGGILPNPRSRYCSSEMKTRTMHRYLRSIGFTEWDTMLGIRADEPKRVATFRRNPHPETKDEMVLIPLADAGVSARDVGDFWRAQEFDLGLPNMNGKTMHGNCDLCFLKPAHQVYSLVAEKPERAIWWAEQERQAEEFAHGNGCRFRDERPSYQRMAQYARQQQDMFDQLEESISCLCGD
ncbi:phosphoadenosine phosphosulfate reductase family protein [Paraburkholderia sp. BCC1885]|uniref:phosphoadenosine phosphosulfate reductase family protein n=1 Tax=Paraburkholderia sp. BCC1885 TaxID=2562669 RepID=UPI0011839394|nr:phosphoadenosine phosphosulfate reductase family protein [Paraburkholderia sp. BCC1885]